jgi:hypothetical protein
MTNKLEELLNNYSWNDIEVFAYLALEEQKEMNRQRKRKEKRLNIWLD